MAFDLFKKKDIHNPNIKIAQIPQSHHGDEWGAYWGFGFDKDMLLGLLTDESQRVQMWNKKKLSIDCIKIDNFEICLLLLNSKIASSYPICKIASAYDIETKAVFEWNANPIIEAQILANVKKIGGGINFFVADYLENSDIYKSKNNLTIYLNAFIYGVDEFVNDNPQLSDEFVSYMPYNNEKSGYLYNFIGEISSVKEVKKENIEGYILDLILVRNEDKMFEIPAFINKKNTKIEEFKKGMKVSGVFALHGKINNN